MSSLAIVVPTYERPAYVRRLLGYFERVKLTHQIVVADSSRDPNAAQNEAATRGSSLQVEYRRFPTEISPYAKIAKAAEALTSPYAAVCADDDFVIPGGLAAAVRTLEANPALSVVHGRAAVVVVDDAGTPTYSVDYPLVERLEPSAAERVRAHLASYRPTFCSVHRREVLVESMAAASAYSGDYRFGELLTSCVTVIMGQVGRFEDFYMVRTDHRLRDTNTSTSTRMREWGAFILAEDFSRRWWAFRGDLVHRLRDAGEASGAAERALDEGFLAFVQPRLGLSAAARSSLERLWARREPIVELVRSFDSGLVRALAGSYPARKPGGIFRDALDDMSLPRLRSARSPFFDDFAQVDASLR